MTRARPLLPAVVLATWLLPALAVAAPVGTLTGKVTDVGSGKAVAQATVRVVELKTRNTARTGANGRYELAGVPPGVYTVKCQRSGYEPVVARKVRVRKGKKTTQDFRLKLRPPPPPEAEAVRALEDRSMRRKRPMAKSMPKRSMRLARAASPARRPPRPRPPPPPPPSEGRPGQPPATEEYDKIDENPFRSARRDPLSTFSIDVDTASYSNVRRFIEGSRLPPKDAVKIEELINYFSYQYQGPRGPDPFSVHTEVSVAPWNPEHRLALIGLQGRRIDTGQLPPSNLVFLLDVSGSMNSPDKLPLLKAAFKLLVNSLKPDDHVAIVVYAGAAGLVLPATPARQRDRILMALDALSAGGSTAGGAGIQLAYEVAKQHFAQRGNNRVILATDGDFNVGVASDGALVRLIEEKRDTGVFLTVLGFGTGNYKDSKMEQLADKGNGNHAYIDSILEAKKVLVSEMGGTLHTIAKDVKIQVEFNPARVKGYRLIGYENRMLAAQDFNDDKKDAGELGAGHSVTALYEIIPAGSQEAIPGVDELKYQQAKLSPAATRSQELMTVKLRYKEPDGKKSKLLTHPCQDRGVALDKTSADFRFATAVAEFGLLLRKSKHQGNASYERVLQRAKQAAGQDGEGYRYEFGKLVEKARLLETAGAR